MHLVIAGCQTMLDGKAAAKSGLSTKELEKSYLKM